jgi:peptidoglycan/LPS O-acetylase OafA/YrhL
MKDSPNLDLLRSVAISLVVFSHLNLKLGWVGDQIELIARTGVGIFFVHTCVVLLQSLERHGEGFAPFMVRRALRIYPLSIVVVSLMAFGSWAGGLVVVDPMQVLSNVLLIQNLTWHGSIPGPLWSLPYEVQMYLFLPAMFLLVRRGLVSIVVLWALVVVVVLAIPSLTLIQYVPCFLAGVLSYGLSKRVTPRFSPAVLFFVLAVGVAAIMGLSSAGVPYLPLQWGLCLTLGLTIPLCRQLTYKPLASLAKTVAKYSYGVYLTHLFAIAFGFNIFGDQPLVVRFALFAFVIFAFPRVAYRWIEAPGIRLGARLADRLKRQKEIAAADRGGRSPAAVVQPHIEG